MFKTAVFCVAVAIVGLLAYATTQPDQFQVERSIDIEAEPALIFARINDLHLWSTWSPYEKLDPGMKRTFSGSEAGLGAVYGWRGNKNAGAGRMEIIESTPLSHIAIQLDFSEPLESHNRVDFTLQALNGITHVTWSMQGPMPFVSKVLCIFFSMDALIGKDFEAGLANLKQVTEH